VVVGVDLVFFAVAVDALDFVVFPLPLSGALADFVFFAVVMPEAVLFVFAPATTDLPFGAVDLAVIVVLPWPDFGVVGAPALGAFGPFAGAGAVAFGLCVGLVDGACAFGAFDPPFPFPCPISDALDSTNSTAIAAKAILQRISVPSPFGAQSARG
jgi:hypothetical protein